MVLENKNLIILSLPKDKKFDYILLKLVSLQDSLPVTNKRKNNRAEKYDVKFNLWNVPNGLYFVEIYSAPEKYSNYVSYIHGETLLIQIDNYSVEFIDPPTLPKNKDIFENNQQDNATLDHYLLSSEMVQSDHPIIVELAQNITNGVSSDYDKVKAIHDWVSENIWYDYDELYSGIYCDKSVIETIASKKGVCIDYASLTASLLRAVGVPAKLVSGYVLNTSSRESWTEELIGSNKTNHVWNEAYVDGRWIIIDTTYDSNNTYKNKTFSIGTGMKNRKYFDMTIEFLSTDRYIVPSQLDPAVCR